MAIKIFGYKPGSRSASSLARGLGARVLKHRGSQYRPRVGDTIINWGSADANNPLLRNALNKPAMVNRATNKLTAFRRMQEAGVRVPEFWTRREDIPNEVFGQRERRRPAVVCRTVLSGHSGVGIVLARSRRDLVAAPLYTRYIPKQDEYRVHVCRTSIISVQRKALRNGWPNPNHQVRNLDGGYVYVRDGVNPPADVTNQALAAINALGLDFGAVDVIWNNHEQRAYVLEVNTAPGLEGTTVEHYVAALGRIAR